ncbi:type IX secretion system protein PorQ [Chryseosolibacter indicus]|uniref:type IX secretion system protein PorQ n=1 Tax=Chryseosolibacter indicus TaxID=2782351 RepID=UPI0020B3F979|nr:type IX secretion system protein PorQ [Chryseosolibacter indicus]
MQQLTSLPLVLKIFSLLTGMLVGIDSYGQAGGERSFQFLNVASSARLSGLGGVNVSLTDRDVNFFVSNPALVGDTLSGLGSASYQFYVADIGHSTIVYSNKFKKAGLFTLGIQHMNYGTVMGYDPSGAETGEFKAQETALLISKSHQAGNFRIGVTLKGIFSGIGGYNATAVAADIGGVFIHPEEQFTIGLAVKNVGLVISDYSNPTSSRLPFDVQLGTTFKPRHMPLRFSITAYNLAHNDIVHNNPADVNAKEPTVVSKIFSHLNFGGEVLLHKNVNILLGYNYLNHQALKLENAGGGAGLSLGFSATVKRFDFAFSRMAYMAGKAAYSFTLSTNINKLLRRK